MRMEKGISQLSFREFVQDRFRSGKTTFAVFKILMEACIEMERIGKEESD